MTDTSSLSSAPSSESDALPEDFPLDAAIYDQDRFADYAPPSSPPPQAKLKDPHIRSFESLYPLSWLVATDQPPADGAPAYPAAPIGHLRKKWQQAFQQADNGAWRFVEYVPAWSDPDWTTRFTYTSAPKPAGKGGGGGDDDDDDDDDDDNDDDDAAAAMARQYAKPGSLQTQRPALRPEDAALDPTPAAKRWGVYPWQTWDGLEGLGAGDLPRGWSGTTPRAAGAGVFPTIALDAPRFSVDRAGVVSSLTVEDVANERQRLERARRQAGQDTTDEDFRQALRAVSLDVGAGPARQEVAASLVALFESMNRIEERAAYQRFLFAGNTSNELVEQNAWTLGADATADLAMPLHDLLLRSKWIRTEERGQEEDAPRMVYNISGKQGEYTAHDETLWAALQPALQLVTHILHSQHPATWVWADVRKLRPVEDARETRNNSRKWMFCVSPDHTVAPNELTGLAATWADFVAICSSGFDSTPYVCEILRRTIEWDIKSEWRNSESGSEAPAYGVTTIFRNEEPPMPGEFPFNIVISISANLLWPLLMDEYSPAEKAASTLYVAGTMLHELAVSSISSGGFDQGPRDLWGLTDLLQYTNLGRQHAVVIARCQMLMDGDPPWLRIEPSWRREIAQFNKENNVDILHSLQTFGKRMRWDEAQFEDHDICWPKDEVFWGSEPQAEEGFATENQYFGGKLEALASAVLESLPYSRAARFLGDGTYIASLTGWDTDPGPSQRFHLQAALPMPEYQKLFSQQFWKSDYMAYGPSAMKLNTGSIRASVSLTHFKPWKYTAARFGEPASFWMRTAWRRLKGDNERQFLWLYLTYQTMAATEPEACEKVWFNMQETWNEADIAVWNDRSAAAVCAVALNTAIRRNTRLDSDTVLYPGVAPPSAEFRQFVAAAWHVQGALSREATYLQSLAARFIKLEKGSVKNRLLFLHAERIRMRVASLYMRVAQDVLDAINEFNDLGNNRENIRAWFLSAPDIAHASAFNIPDLLTKLEATRQHLSVVCDVFAADAPQRRVGVDQLGAIPSGGAQTLSERIKRLAMRQYHAMAADDPRRKVADEWNTILRSGDGLKDPAPGSPAAAFNQQLQSRVQSIDAGVLAHQAAVLNSHPDAQRQRQIAGPALPNQQPPPDAVVSSADRERTFTLEEQQAFAIASGFRPYRDATTGFTHFADERAQQPNFQQGQNDRQEQQQQYYQQVQQQQQGGFDAGAPAAPAALSPADYPMGEALTPGQQQQFLEDKNMWRQNYGS